MWSYLLLLAPSVVDNVEWAFTGVCGPNVDYDRTQLWDELAG